MNENKRNMLLSFYFNFIYLLSLLPFSSNEYVYVISKIGLGWCNEYCHDERVLVFSKQKMRHLLN